MIKPTTKITPLDPTFHGESNYEVGLEDLLLEKKTLVTNLESDPKTSYETLHIAREELSILEGLWENYHIGMNVFRNAKGGREGIREIKTD